MLALLLAFPVPQTEKAAETSKPPGPRPLVVRGATVHTMLPGDAPRVQDVWVEGGHIRALGEKPASVSDPIVLEARGKHVVPGLLDAHVNFDPEHDALYLAAGVTLVRDLGGDHYALHLESAPERRDAVPGPTLLTAGAALDGDPPGASTAVVLRDAGAAESYLPILFEEGVDFLSILPGLPEDAWRKTIALAHERQKPVFGPRPAGLSLETALEAGQDGFHALDSLLPVGVFWDTVTSEQVGDAIAALATAHKPIVPLLHASALRLDDQELDPERRALAGLLAPSYESWWRMELSMRRPFLEPERRKAGELVLEKQARALRALFDAGAVLLPGSGSPQPWCVPGTALHQELAQWVRAGISPAAVLELATRGAAEALGLAGERGTIQDGAWADLLVLDQDPTTDLAHLLDPAWVVVRGIPVSHESIGKRLDALARRQAEVRAELAKPVEVAPPPQGEEGVVLLEGTVQSDAFGSPVSTERYRVVRISGDVLLFTSRTVFPATAAGQGRELTLEQFVRAGRLEQAHAALQQGEHRLEHDGLWTAGTWRMQSRLDGKIVSSPPPFSEQPACVDAEGVLTCLMLGQLPSGDRIPVVQLHPGLDAEAVYWRMELGEDGIHRVRTQLGYKAFKLDAVGAVEFALTKVGVGTVETRAQSSSAFGGAGLPVPKDDARARSLQAAGAETAGAPRSAR